MFWFFVLEVYIFGGKAQLDDYVNQNLHWKLGQQTQSAGTLLAYLDTTA